MKRIIGRRVYDTETAKCLGAYENGYNPNDFHYYYEGLYRTKSGKYFLHGSGGGLSRYGVWRGNSGGSGEKIMPMTLGEAMEWAEKHLDADEYIAIFGEQEDGDDKTPKLILLSSDASRKLERMRDESGTSQSDIIEKLIIEA